MGRLLPLLLLGPALAAAEGYAFAGAPRTYLYHLDQQVTWASAGISALRRRRLEENRELSIMTSRECAGRPTRRAHRQSGCQE